MAGGVDLAGDAYDADSTDPAKRIPHPDADPMDCNGHGKLAKAFAIDSSCNGKDLFGDEFFVEDAPPLPKEMIGSSNRVGISRSRELPWRKFILNNPHVSKGNVTSV